jgi:putative addiction module component (TIGR02574 family)
MSLSEDEIVQAAMALPTGARAELADSLLESLRGLDETEIDPAWVAELERRIDDYDSGRVKGIPADEVLRPRHSENAR